MKNIKVTVELYDQLSSLSNSLGFDTTQDFVINLLEELIKINHSFSDDVQEEFIEQKMTSLGYL
jgi:hypothetical protein